MGKDRTTPAPADATVEAKADAKAKQAKKAKKPKGAEAEADEAVPAPAREVVAEAADPPVPSAGRPRGAGWVLGVVLVLVGVVVGGLAVVLAVQNDDDPPSGEAVGRAVAAVTSAAQEDAQEEQSLPPYVGARWSADGGQVVVAVGVEPGDQPLLLRAMARGAEEDAYALFEGDVGRTPGARWVRYFRVPDSVTEVCVQAWRSATLDDPGADCFTPPDAARAAGWVHIERAP